MRCPREAFAIVLLTAGAAQAQVQVKGRVLVIVDTSTSMLWHFGDNTSAGGDGDAQSLFSDVSQAGKSFYPGRIVNGAPDGPNSRMYAAKHAIASAIASAGDLDFGIMRYALRANCTDPTWCCPLAQGACLAPPFDYVDNGGKITFWGGCGPVVNGQATDGGQLLVTPGSGSSARALAWVDNVEDFRDGGQGAPKNPELRAAGTTPIAGSMRTAINAWYAPTLAFSKQNPNCDPKADARCDPQIDCRPYALVVLTDGGDSCEGTSTEQDKNPPLVAQQLHDANPQNPPLTYVVGLAISVAGNITVMNNMAAAGGTGKARFASSQADIETAFADITASAVKYELCNGKDDTCDGVIDEGFDKGARCSVGQGACLRAGVKKCTQDGSGTDCCADDGNPGCVPLAPGAPIAEACNGVDDDCNGVIDDPPVCAGGCRAVPEICNGKDDDCDGVIDNHLVDLGRPCGLALGECKSGMTTCVPDPGKNFPDPSDHLACAGGSGPSPEVCDGLDNDCDGVVDGITRTCYGGPNGTDGVGLCHGGLQKCSGGAFQPCIGELRPAPEVCNGLDDDCNGKVDDVIGAGGPCCPSMKCGVGACKAGTLKCSGGGIQCVGYQGPTPELCNGADDDCNGAVDDLPNLGKPCVSGGGCAGALACIPGKHAVVCEPSGMKKLEVCDGVDNDCDGLVDELPDVAQNDPAVGRACGNGKGLPPPCRAGQTICRAGKVICDGEVGPSAEVCDGIDNDCDGKVDNAASCPADFVCVMGRCDPKCVSSEFPCPGGFVEQSVGGTCVCVPAHACSPPCAAPTFCDEATGTCVDPCGHTQCGAGLVCDHGQCVGCEKTGCAAPCTRCDTASHRCEPDLCCHASCPTGQVCQTSSGACVGTCAGGCRPGEVCVAGVCQGDPCAGPVCLEGLACNPATGRCEADPCASVQCPAGLACCAGRCGPDPCAGVSCGASTGCGSDPFSCQPVCRGAPPDQVLGAGGGFACALGPRRSSEPGWLRLAALLALLGVRRSARSRRPGRSGSPSPPRARFRSVGSGGE